MNLRMVSTILLGVLIAGCTTNPYTGERQASKKAVGAGVGAAVGAVVGAIGGDDADERRKRALIGAGVGALAGTAVGAYMDRQEAALRQQLQNTGVSVTRMGDNLVLNMPGNITFAVDEASIQSDFYEVLDSVALVLKEYEKTLIDVTGHTDSTGGYEYNMRLSQRRAQSVGDYLESRGIEPLRIRETGVGPDYPVASNETERGRQLNRRVELVLKPLT
ncbi:MAG: OmpA family protein [Pseudomonadales bacterium]|nr:OmpA family protein [Pseudomonadales bacterium]